MWEGFREAGKAEETITCRLHFDPLWSICLWSSHICLKISNTKPVDVLRELWERVLDCLHVRIFLSQKDILFPVFLLLVLQKGPHHLSLSEGHWISNQPFIVGLLVDLHMLYPILKARSRGRGNNHRIDCTRRCRRVKGGLQVRSHWLRLHQTRTTGFARYKLGTRVGRINLHLRCRTKSSRNLLQGICVLLFIGWNPASFFGGSLCELNWSESRHGSRKGWELECVRHSFLLIAMISVSLEPKWRHFAQVNIADIFMLSSKLPKQNENIHTFTLYIHLPLSGLFILIKQVKQQTTRTHWKIKTLEYKNHLPNLRNNTGKGRYYHITTITSHHIPTG